MAGPLISFLSDLGAEAAPAVCRGVMWSVAPDARIPVLVIYSFGNARLAGRPEDRASVVDGELNPGRPFRVTGGSIPPNGLSVGWHSPFGEVARGEPLLREDADYGGLGVAVNQGSTAERLGLAIATRLEIEAGL